MFEASDAASGSAGSPRRLAEEVAWSQGGLLTLAQAKAAGLTKDAVYRLVRTKCWNRALPGILRVGPSTGWQQSLRAACMWAGPGAAGSHRSAGVVHELDGISAVGVEITCRRRRRSPAEWLLVHESVAPFGVHHVDGIPVTPVARTLIDLSSFIPKTHLERALEDSLRRRLTSIPSLKMALLQERGRRRAAGALRELILARDPNASPTDSELEVRVLQALAEAGLPPPERQHRVSGPSGFKARLDFAYPEAKIAIEADSYRWHTGRSAFVRDRGRLSVLASLEWRVVLVTWDDLAMKRDGWLGSLRRLYGQQRLL